MTDIAVIDEWITTDNGYSIFTKTWKPSTTIIAQIVLVHGFGEHIARYDRMFQYLAEHGIQSYGFDQRGFGKSGQKAGDFGNNHGYDTVLCDINAAIHRVKQPDVPLFLMGHSMGGGLILNLLFRSEKYDGVKLVTGAIASAPLVRLSMPISPFRYYPLMCASKIIPSFTIQAGLHPDAMSHDADEVKKLIEDPLVHDYATLGTVRSFLDAGEDVIKQAHKIKTPIVYSHGIPDAINDYKATKIAYENTASTDKTLKAWDNLFHDLHNETPAERQQVMDYYLQWIKARIPSTA
ncbi:alpha/beta-hydrolase [Lichtheimia hyalospora FSU 10163]|nr:alpha/beta-hydrolase [Lichtheimia hyalospora FSU 10163]